MTFARLPFGPSVDDVSNCSSVVASKKGRAIVQHVACPVDLESFDGPRRQCRPLSKGCRMMGHARKMGYATTSR